MRAIKVLLVGLLIIVMCSTAGAGTFRFTASADNRPYDSGNLSRWEWLLDEMDRLFVDDEGVFHIMPGDIDPPETTDSTLVDQFGGDVVWYPVVGNHEAETPADMTWIRGAFSSLPYVVNGGPSGCETTTYSFDYGNAHFVAINEYYDGTSDTGTDGDVVDALYNWLAADLAANTKPAVFVIGHEPAYPEYAHVGDSLDGHPENRDRFWKLLNDEKVIAYFCGHTHWYYAKQVDGDDWDPFTWQIDCGNAGNPREPEQTFIDVAVTDTDVTFTVWQGLEGNSYSVRETWNVEIPFVVAHSPSPADGATGVLPASVPLSATVENPSEMTYPVDVEFFGREAPSFSIVVLPDTQNYVNLLDAGTPEMFTSQTQWIADNAATMNIVFVTHEGDITDNTDRPEQGDVPAEWERANTSMSVLDGVVPYGLLPGNHDKPTTYFNECFPYTRYDSEPWYGGHYPSTVNDNNYELFSAGGDDYIILHLEDQPPGDVITWADSVLKDAAHASRKAIIVTHRYIDAGGNIPGGSPEEAIWTTLVQGNDSVFFVLNGHYGGEKLRTDIVNGRTVYSLLANYQSRANGGDGWLRIMTFEPDADEVYVQTYSPWLDQYETDGDSDFVLAFDMTSTSYYSIDSDMGVASGSVATTPSPWTSLSMETQYEWYVTVADTVTPAIMAGPVWDFTMASLKASNPDPANGATDVDVDADLSWSAGIDAVSHDVYFGTDAGNLPQVSTLQPGTTYDPGTLQQGVTYYWAIDEHDSESGVVYGYVWSFTTTLPQPVAIVSAGAVWKYFDQVDSDQGAWYDPSFDDISWLEGPAELGYGDGGEATEIDGSPVRASYYFRRTFTAAEAYNNLVLNVVRDDGCVVYLNGEEIGRSNMPTGDILWDAWAAAVTTNESDWWGISVDPLVSIQPGINVLAVSVHQAHSTSSDVSFNLELLGVVAPGQPVANDDSDTTDEDMPVTIDVLVNDTDPDGDSLTVASVTQGANGTVVISLDEKTVTYTSNLNFDGVDTFTYRASDGYSNSNPATVTVTIIGDNDPPVTHNDLYNLMPEEAALIVDVLEGVLANDSDPEHDPLTATLSVGPDHGDIVLNEDGSFTYTPDPDDGFAGVDSFVYLANDGTNSSTATVEIAVYMLTKTEDVAQSEIAVDGTVTTGDNNYKATWSDDGAAEMITEVVSGKNQAQLRSLLEHKWQFDVAGGDTVKFHLDAQATIYPQSPDTFVFSYSTDDVTYTDIATVTYPVDDDYPLPDTISGTVYIRVQDTNRDRLETTADAISIDYMCIISATTSLPDSDPPSAPTGLSATPGDSQISLTWNPNGEPDIAGYKVYRDGGLISGETTLVMTTEYTDTGLTNGTSYTYKITAVDTSDNESTQSDPISATPQDHPPEAPTGLSATPGDSQVSLTWNLNGEPDIAGYKVYRDDVLISGETTLVMTTEYTDTGLTNGTSYTYNITAVDTSDNESTQSDPISATPQDLPPEAPTGLSATPGDSQVSLTWNLNGEPDIAGYKVYRDDVLISGETTLVMTTEYTDTGLTNGTSYTYNITAVDTSDNESTQSDPISATPDSQQTVYVSSIDMSLGSAGKNMKASAGITISETQSGATVYGDWYYKGALIQSGATSITDAAGYTVITSAPKKAKSGDVFRFVVTDVVLSGYLYDPGQQGITENSITVP